MAKGQAVAEVAELRQQIEVVDANIMLVNERLNESQSMCSVFLVYRKY